MPRPGLRSFYTNFSTYEAPLHTKLSLALRNTVKKIRTGSNCCGNHGQPGC